MIGRLAPSLCVALFTLGLAAPAGAAGPVVDCASAHYTPGASAKSLMGWAQRYYDEVTKTGSGMPERACYKADKLLGQAWCAAGRRGPAGDMLREVRAACEKTRSAPKAGPPATPGPPCVMSPVPDQGATSKHHAANVGRIVWSKAPIAFRSEPRRTDDRFRGSDPIYGRLYLAKSLHNTCVVGPNGQGRTQAFGGGVTYRMTVDGQPLVVKFGSFHSTQSIGQGTQTWTTWRLDLSPKAGDAGEPELQSAWNTVLSRLAPGEHRVEIEIYATQGAFESELPIAAGGFTFTFAEGDEVGSGGLPPAVMSNPSLERAMAKAITAAGWSEEVLEVVITDAGWAVKRHPVSGRIVKRVLGTAVAVKTTTGVCKVFSVSFKQEHDGRSYGPTMYNGVGSSRVVPCARVR